MRHRHRSNLAVTCIVATTLSGGAMAAAQAPGAVRVSGSAIEPQALDAALEQVRDQTGLQITYVSAVIRGKTSQGAPAGLAADQTLMRVLEGTGLTFQWVDEKTVRVRALDAIGHGQGESTETDSNQLDQGTAGGVQSTARHQASVAEGSSPNSEEGQAPSKQLQEPTVDVPEILVQGSKILNMDIQRSRDDAQPYVVFDRDSIAQSGATTIDEFLKNSLTMSATAASSSQDASVGSPSSRINLRGLGAKQTLILVDGHRVASYSTGGEFQQADINGIPLSAIERIEILPTTASGIYGGGATGGAINVVLRRDYSGIETKVSYGGSFSGGGSNRRIDFSAGENFEGGRSNLLVAGSYFDANPLLAADRDVIQRGRQWTLDHNPDAVLGSFSPPLGATTNILSGTYGLDGTPEPLSLKNGNTPLNSLITYVPPGYAGAASDGGAAFLGTAGNYNLDLANTAQLRGGARHSLYHEPTIKAVDATLRREMSSRIDAFVELGISENSNRVSLNGATDTFFIPSSSPNNPFNQDIIVNTPAIGADRTAISEIKARRAVGGLIVKLSDSWRASVDYTWNRTRFETSTPDILDSNAASAVGSGQLDVLRDTNLFPTDFSPFADVSRTTTPVESTLKNATLRIAGSLPITLPAGPLAISTLVEHRDETVNQSIIFASNSLPSDFLLPRRSQSVESIYAEMLVPLISQLNDFKFARLLELQIAARRDEYSVNGTTGLVTPDDTSSIQKVKNKSTSISPTIAFRFTPMSSVMLRSSFGKGFLPPSVDQLVPSTPVPIPAFFFGLTDPRRGGEPVTGDSSGNLLLSGGGNANLRPEKSESWSAGVVLTPSAVTGLRFSIDWTKIKKRDEIVQVLTLSQSDFDNEQFVPQIFVRETPVAGDPFGVGPVVGLYAGLLNIASRNVESYDFAFDYDLDAGSAGTFSFSSVATKLVHLKTQVTPAAPVIENAGAIATLGQDDAGLHWKANAKVTWRRQAFQLSWTTRYFDKYWLSPNHLIDQNQGSAFIPSQIYHDIAAAYSFGSANEASNELLSNIEIAAGIKNIFDKEPPVDVVGPSPLQGSYGYSSWGDPLRSVYYLSIRKQF